MADVDRLNDLRRFYDLLAALERKLGGKRTLADCDGRMDWPRRGVYFFFETGEIRVHSGQGLRVVRVGTHARTSGGRTTLWKRLSRHRGVRKSGGGDHRGSIFRLHVGTALINRDRLAAGSRRYIGAKAPAPAQQCAWLSSRWNKPSASTSARCRSCGWLWMTTPAPPASAG